MKHLIISFAVLALLIVPNLALGDDVDDLKAVNELHIKAFNSLDAATLASLIHPGFAIFNRDAPFAIVRSKNFKEAEAEELAALKGYFDTLEWLKVTIIDYKYKVVGNTGIMWGYYMEEAKPKDGPVRTVYARGTSTWIKSEGKWRIIMAHDSAIPAGD
jgi:ketosteroid isomerase-like protein